MKIEVQRAVRMILYMDGIPDEQFDILHWVARMNGKSNWGYEKNPECGTVCCFVGHLPLAFPKDFAYTLDEATVRRTGDERDIIISSAAEFFGMTDDQMIRLAFPEHYDEGPNVSKGVVLGRFIDTIKDRHGIDDMDELLAQELEARMAKSADSWGPPRCIDSGRIEVSLEEGRWSENDNG